MTVTPPGREPREERRSTVRDLAQLATVGIMFPVSIATGFGIGWWLDGHLGTWPWLTGFFTVCGAAAAFFNLFKAGAPHDRNG